MLYVVPHSTVKSDGVNGESAERVKARLESHQRIAERAVCLLVLLYKDMKFLTCTDCFMRYGFSLSGKSSCGEEHARSACSEGTSREKCNYLMKYVEEIFAINYWA